MKENNKYRPSIQTRLSVCDRNIVSMKTDAIVNSAHHTLSPGSGISCAIHRAAGPELYEECRKLGYLEIGQAVITKAYNLPCKNVIHISAPRYYSNLINKEDKLAECYKNIIEIAENNRLRTLAIPPLGMGVYKWPYEIAIEIAVSAVIEALSEDSSLKYIMFAVNGNIDIYEQYKKTILMHEVF